MRGVSRRIVKMLAVAGVVATLVVPPAFAEAKTSERGGGFVSLVRMIIRAFDTIDISFPPG